MPKSYTEQERVHIVKKLREAAVKSLSLYGVKKTTVDELVKEAKIPKGTFYLFYESKERLLFEVIQGLHEEIENDISEKVIDLKGNITVDNMTEILCEISKKVFDTGLIRMLTMGDIDMLMRKLPVEVLHGHLNEDDEMVDRFFSAYITSKEERKVVSGALRGVFMLALNKKEIGEEVFDDSLKFLIRGILLQVMNV